jgi:hypothetical protein
MVLMPVKPAMKEKRPMADYRLIMLSNAKTGRDEEFKKWYERHLDDMLRIPGVTAAQTYDYDMELSERPEAKFKYMALYEIATDDLSQSLMALQKAAGTDAMPMSDAMDPKSSAIVYRARGPRRTRK